MIIGVGIDIIEVSRIRTMMKRHAQRFLDRVFTISEQEYSQRARRAAEHFAARFAAKEAAMKALGTGLADGIEWTDIEVAHVDTGRPILVLHRRAAALATALGVTSMHLSLTHVAATAAAVVVFESGQKVGIIARPSSQLSKPIATVSPRASRKTVDKPRRVTTLRGRASPASKRHKGRGRT